VIKWVGDQMEWSGMTAN